MVGSDGWPEAVVADTNALLQYVGRFAQDMVVKDGAVVPCGAGLSAIGVVEPFVVDSSGFTSMDEAYAFLVNSVASNRDEWRAVCLVVAVTSEGEEALRFHVEHVTGQCLVGVMVYRRARLFDRVVFDELATMPVASLIWARDAVAGGT
jgi:hypothetical protein